MSFRWLYLRQWWLVAGGGIDNFHVEILFGFGRWWSSGTLFKD
jgi:hypothetical protein